MRANLPSLHLPGLMSSRCSRPLWRVLTIYSNRPPVRGRMRRWPNACAQERWTRRSEEHTSELQSLMRISYAVFCLKKKINTNNIQETVENQEQYVTK